MKKYFFGLLAIVAIAFTSCSQDEQKQNNQLMSKDAPSFMYSESVPTKEDENFVLTYENENGSIIKEIVSWKDYKTGLDEVPFTQSLFQDSTLVAGNTNGVARIKSATIHHTRHGVYYTGCLIDDNTGQTMIFYYSPAQQDPSTLIMQTHPYFAQWPAGPDNC